MSYSPIRTNKCSATTGNTSDTNANARVLSANVATTKPQSASASVNVDPWAGFYKKSLENRQQHIHGVFPKAPLKEELGVNVADHMIENCIGTFGLPLGLGLNFKVNGKDIVVPMATEEPSVIAAVSGAAKIISQHGGFTSSYSGNIMVCQIQLLEVPNIDQAVKAILDKENQIIEHGNMHVSESMRKRGGGVIKIIPRIIAYDKSQYFNIHQDSGAAPTLQPSSELVLNDRNKLAPNAVVEEKEAKAKAEEEKEFMLIINVHVDVCEAMGANIINTVAEGLSPFLVKLVGGRVGLQIISNYAVERRAIATFRVPVSKLAYKDKSGEDVARGILEGYAMACSDSYRAVTHNKGIMNGIDAAAIALGQDFRAIESGAHAWASRTGSYQPLTHYRLVRQGDELMFEGTLELPVPIGTRGGAVQSHPTVKYTHQLMQNPDCSTLGGVLVSVGLAQNFAALRAMASEGIQRGHMSLHSKNIAIQANVPHEHVGDVSTFLVASGVITNQAAQDYLYALNILKKYSKENTRNASVVPSPSAAPSSLYASIKVRDTVVSVIVLCDTYANMPTHLNIKPIVGSLPPIQSAVLGAKHTSRWLSDFFLLAQNLSVKEEARVNREKEPEQLRIQLLSVLLQTLTFQLLHISPIAARDLVLSMVKDATTPAGLTSQEKLKLFFSKFSTNSQNHSQNWKSKMSAFFHPDGLMLDPFFEAPVPTEDVPVTVEKPPVVSKLNLDPSHPTQKDWKSKLTSFFHPDGLLLDPLFETACCDATYEVQPSRNSATGAQAQDQGRVFAFKVGAPLLLSLWWSLQHYIDKDVPHKALAQALKIEQLRAMSSLSRSVGFYETMPGNLAEFMETHASNLMLPFWLLSEAISVDSQFLNSKTIKHLTELGRVLAWRGTLLEDLDSFNLENSNQLNNSYLLWLHINSKAHEGQSTIQQFKTELEALLAEKQNMLLASNYPFIDTRALLSPDRLAVVRRMIKEIVESTETVPAKARL